MNIETERLIIRDPIIEDFEAIWAMRNDEDVTTFTGGVTKRSKDQVYESHIKECADLSSGPKEYAVVLKDSGDYIGYCGFQYCELLKDIEILYGYAKAYWGKGYALEAAKAVMDYGLNELKLDKVVAAVNYDNVASDQVLIKIGMTYQGDIEWPDQGMVKSYVKYRVVPLDQVEITEHFLDDFERKQIVSQRYSIKSGKKSLEDISFVDDWSREERRHIVKLFLMESENKNYYSSAVIDKGELIGFMILCKKAIGPNKEYLEVKELQIGTSHRRKGIGSLLFNDAVTVAKELGAEKLYLSTHSAKESHEFYLALGCDCAKWLSPQAVETEPYDIQMEYIL